MTVEVTCILKHQIAQTSVQIFKSSFFTLSCSIFVIEHHLHASFEVVCADSDTALEDALVLHHLYHAVHKANAHICMDHTEILCGTFIVQRSFREAVVIRTQGQGKIAIITAS